MCGRGVWILLAPWVMPKTTLCILYFFVRLYFVFCTLYFVFRVLCFVLFFAALLFCPVRRTRYLSATEKTSHGSISLVYRRVRVVVVEGS